ncbi:MAG: hypothetical protein NXI00_24265, partial [Cytophagales bacterium]|nr:hypothetical protein [Cytophagales bacterium]
MAYGYIRTETKDSANPDRKLLDKVIEIIGDCFDFNDDDVQIQIIKAFLTAVSSPICQIHERALLNAIRACFNIFLASRSSVIQMTAKATLSQMLSILFQRFEVILLFQLRIALFLIFLIQHLSQKVKEGQQSTSENGETKNEAAESEDSPVPHAEASEPSTTEGINEKKIENGKEKQAEYHFRGSDDVEPKLAEELSAAYVDCFLSFRALCKLSMKELSPNSPI